jgi:hypothetical protein
MWKWFKSLFFLETNKEMCLGCNRMVHKFCISGHMCSFCIVEEIEAMEKERET